MSYAAQRVRPAGIERRHVALSLEVQVRAHLDATRGLSDAALKLQTGHADEVDLADVLLLLVHGLTALMDCSVDIARAVDQLAEHTDYRID